MAPAVVSPSAEGKVALKEQLWSENHQLPNTMSAVEMRRTFLKPGSAEAEGPGKEQGPYFGL